MRNVLLAGMAGVACLVFASCATANPIYTAPAEDGGQLCFLRPVEFAVGNPLVSRLDLDMTLVLHDGEIRQPVVMNYTLLVPVEGLAESDRVVVRLTDGLSFVTSVSQERLFRRPDGEFRMAVRYSVELEGESLQALLKSGSSCKIHLEFPDGTEETLESEEFSRRIQNLRLMML